MLFLKNAKKEHLKIKNINGESEEMTGDNDSCYKTSEMLDIMNNGRLLYTIHNHPSPFGCLMSDSDIMSIG